MKKLFLSSSFADVANVFGTLMNESITGKTITFIPTASSPENIKFYVKSGRRALEKLGLVVDDLDISTAKHEEIKRKLKINEYIYISGGNTFFLLQELIKTGTDKLLLEQIELGKMLIAESAGSMIMSPNIEYVKDMDDCSKAPELMVYDALNIVDFYPLPHCMNFPFKKAAKKIMDKYNQRIKLYPISNSQAIIVKDDKIEIVNK